MTLEPHHRWALGAAVVTSTIAVTDAVTHGLTGHNPFSDESDLPAAALVLVEVAHGLTYVALAVVLLREADRFRSTNVVARLARWVVLVSLCVLAVGFLTVAPLVSAREDYDSGLYTTFSLVGGPAFFGLILGSLVLGLSLLRSQALGVGARVLALLLPVFGLTLLLAWLLPSWAHPAYLETTLQTGLALLGVGASAPVCAGTYRADGQPGLPAGANQAGGRS